MNEAISVGLAFTAKDGVSKSVTNIQKSLTATNGKMRETQVIADGKGGASRGGIFQGLIEGAKLFSLSNLNSKVNDISDALSGSQKGFDDTFKTLDKLRAKVGFAFDTKSANAYNNKILQVMASTGLTGNETESLASGMMEYGRSLKEASAVLPMMGQMVGVLGIDASKVSQMFGEGLASLRATPKQLQGVIKEVVRIQKAYNLTDQVSGLPDIFENVTKNSAQFGKINTQMSLNTVRSMAGVSAAFQKTGMSQSKAMATTLGLNDSLTEMRRSISDMNAGEGTLSPKILKIAEAFSFAGKDGEDMMNKIANGMNPDQLVKEIQGALKGLDKDTTSVVSAKLRTALGDDIMHLVQGFPDELAKNMDTKNIVKNVGSADKAFQDYQSQMKNTVDWQEKARDSAKALVDIHADFANKGDMMKALQAQTKSFEEFTKAVQDNESWLGKALKMIKLYNEVGISGFFPELAGAQGFLGIVSSLLSPLLNLLGIFEMFKGPFELFGKLFGNVTKMTTVAEGALGKSSKLAGSLKWLKGMFETIYVHVGVRAIDAFQKLSSVMGRLMSPFSALRIALGETITAFKMGFGEGLAQIAGKAMNLGIKVYQGLTGWVGKAGGQFAKIGKWLRPVMNIFSKVGSFVGNVGSKLSGLGRIFNVFGKAAGILKNVLSAITWGVRAFNMALIANPIGLVIAAVVALGVGIYLLVKHWDTVKEATMGFFSWLGNKLSAAGNWLGDLFSIKGIKESLSGLAQTVYKFIAPVFDPLMDFFKNLWKSIWDMIPSSLQSAFTGMKNIASNVASFFGMGGDGDSKAPAAGLVTSSGGSSKPALAMPGQASGARDNVIPSMQQPGVVAEPTFSKISSAKVEVDDSNSQGIIDEIHQMSQYILKLGDMLVNRPVNVTLVGDAKKFFRAAEQESNNRMGSRGMGG